MINWYYVQGSERIGPVNEKVLQELFQNEALDLESYIWRKGFTNWEKLKDVNELVLSKNVVVNKVKESSPEIILKFDWLTIGENEQSFFIKIGVDRKVQIDNHLYGPYSLKELRESLDEKRINHKTLIFSAGMLGWTEIENTPLYSKGLSLESSVVVDETPLIIIMNNEPLLSVTLVQEAGIKRCVLLGSGPFKVGESYLGSIYSGKMIKAKDLKLIVDEYHPIEQRIVCSISDISDAAKKVMQNHEN